MKLLIGGSPCTYWSIAQTKNRETEASGMGWELFRNYVMARDKFQPDYFLYENNKSMSAAIREQITAMLGVEPVLINSALVSAQNRQRLYWCGKREADGNYSTVPIEQPEDRGILLRDVLESGVVWREKGYALRASEDGKIADSHAVRTIITRGKEACDGVAEPIGTTNGGKSYSLTANYSHDPKMINDYVTHVIEKGAKSVVAEPVNITEDGKAQTIKAQYAKNSIANFVGYTSTYGATGVAEPVKPLTEREMDYVQESGKTNTLSTVLKDNHICEPVRIGTIENDAKNPDFDSAPYRVYSPDGKAVAIKGNAGGIGSKTGLYAAMLEYNPLHDCDVVVTDTNIRCTRSDGGGTAQGYTVYFDDVKAATVSAGHACKMKVIQPATDKEFPVYEVRDGKITIKGKRYPIKLRDGYYIIRKLTVRECMRLQTVPETFEFPVSDSQAYKMLGNGWTVDVIVHLLSHFEGITTESVDVLSMYDGMACGHIALDKMGANIRNYYATEIDKYAIKTATHNFPDIVELGDAFNVRWDCEAHHGI